MSTNGQLFRGHQRVLHPKAASSLIQITIAGSKGHLQWISWHLLITNYSMQLKLSN